MISVMNRRATCEMFVKCIALKGLTKPFAENVMGVT